MADNTETQAAVYVSWATFKNAVESLVEGVPNQIDRTVFPGQSWGVQAQLFAGMRFLGLIDSDQKPTSDLHELAVPDEKARKKKLEQILRKQYADLFALDLAKTTPAELQQKIGESYNVSGDTRDKAVRFFVSAADYLGIRLSQLLKARKPRGGGGTNGATRKRKPKRNSAASAKNPKANPGAEASGGESRQINLKSGGTLTLSASLGILTLIPSDRRFIFELIDKFDEYEESNGGSGEVPKEEESDA